MNGKVGGGMVFLFFFCVFLPALSSSASLVETSHIQYPSSLLLIPHRTVLKQRQITEDNRALRNTGLLDISFLDLYMEEIIM